MNEGHSLNNGEKHNNFALARRPSSAVEKAVPGAKRILSGMVADALILAKKKSSPKIVIVDDDSDYLDLITEFIKLSHKNATVLTFTNPEKALTELFQTDPDLLLLDTHMPKISGFRFLQILASKMVAYPIRVMSSSVDSEFLDLFEKYPTLNAKILDRPFDPEIFRKTLETALKIPSDDPTQNEIISIKSRPLNHRGTLLVVDDEEGVRESMRVIFENKYDLFIADDGATAIELAQQHDIDVVVTNRNMPRMSGYDVLERLKYMKPDIEVMMMSGMDTTDSRRMAFQLGACDYIPKPFDVPTIRAAVSKAMQRRTFKNEITASRKTTGSNTEKVFDQPLQPRPLEIIHVGVNANWLLEAIKAVILQKYKNATVKTYTDGDLAWQELLREEPDLLITTILRDRGIDGYDMISKLATRKAKFPILVYDGLMNIATENHVQQLAGPNLKVSCLYCPFTSEQFFNGLSKLLDNK